MSRYAAYLCVYCHYLFNVSRLLVCLRFERRSQLKNICALKLLSAPMMQAKRLLGVVVGSTDPQLHQKSFDEGEEAARLIEEYGELKTIIFHQFY